MGVYVCACVQSLGADAPSASRMEAGGSEASDMEEYQEASSEAEGMPPRLHLLSDPSTAINIPVTQVSHRLHSFLPHTQVYVHCTCCQTPPLHSMYLSPR